MRYFYGRLSKARELETLFYFTGMRRVWTRGIKSANKFMLGAATAYNLKKWLRYNVKDKNGKVISLGRALASIVNTLQGFLSVVKIG
jgi:hypothetical protein